MAKLFNKIRLKLISEKPSTSRTTNYLKYAIGEIVLVVMGILIALQINMWNTNRIERKKENLILKELHKEFVSNKLQLDSVMFFHKRSYKSVNYIKSKLPINVKETNLDSLSYHLFYMGWTYTFNPSQGVTKALMNSSTFGVVSNDELRQLLISWNDILLDYQEEELWARNNYQNQLKPFEKKHFYWSYDYKKWLDDPRINLDILEDLEFDNYILDRYADLEIIVNNSAGEMDRVIEAIDRIIELSKPKNHD